MMKRYWLLFTVLAVVNEGIIGIILLDGPRNTTVREGQSATLNCSVMGGRSDITVEWYRTDTSGELQVISQDYTLVNSNFTGSYEITGNRRNREYNLMIINANRQDAAVYYCGYKAQRTLGDTGTTSPGAKLQVVVPPNIGSPFCFLRPVPDVDDNDDEDPLSTSPVYHIAGDRVALICSSSGGIPQASLRWKSPGRTPKRPGQRRTELEIEIQESDYDVTFTCFAESPALDVPRECSLIPARRPPSVRMVPERAVVSLNGSARFECASVGLGGTELNYGWFYRGMDVQARSSPGRFQVSADGKSLTVGQIRQADHGARVVCQLQSDEGRAINQAQAIITVAGFESTNGSNETGSNDSETVGETPRSLMSGATLIAVGVGAGVFMGVLVLGFAAFAYKRHCTGKTTSKPKIKPKPKVKPKPNIKPKPPVRNTMERRIDTEDGYVVPERQVTMERRTDTEDGYVVPERQVTMERRIDTEDGYVVPERQVSNAYDAICVPTAAAAAAPVAARLDADGCGGDMDWDYEIPYSNKHVNGQPTRGATATKPVYLEILG